MPDDDDLDFTFDDDLPPEQAKQKQAFERLQKKVQKLEGDLDKKFEEGKQAALKEIEVQTNVSQWATKVGNPKLGEVFLKTKPEEVNEEGFFTFAADLGFKPPEEGETPVAGPTPAPVTPDPFHRTGGAAAPNTQMLSPRDVVEAVARGEMTEAQATQVVLQGRVGQQT